MIIKLSRTLLLMGGLGGSYWFLTGKFEDGVIYYLDM
jgi:hypothetical protein